MNVWVFIGHRRRRLGMCISAIQPQILLPVSGGSRTGYGVGNASFFFFFFVKFYPEPILCETISYFFARVVSLTY